MMMSVTFDTTNIKALALGINSRRDGQMHCRQDILRSKFCAILLLALFTLGKESNIHLAIVVGFRNTGGSHEPLAWQGQMAALTLPYGNPDLIGSCLLQSRPGRSGLNLAPASNQRCRASRCRAQWTAFLRVFGADQAT